MSSALSAQQMARIRSKLEQQFNDSSSARKAQIEAALQRLKIGEYGICIECGDEISSARLSMRPEVALCTDCQALQDEDEGQD